MRIKTLANKEMEGQDTASCENMLRIMQEKQRAKLNEARRKGRGGWVCTSPEVLEQLLQKAIKDNDYVSVANYAGMLYFHRAEC